MYSALHSETPSENISSTKILPTTILWHGFPVIKLFSILKEEVVTSRLPVGSRQWAVLNLGMFYLSQARDVPGVVPESNGRDDGFWCPAMFHGTV